MSTEFEPKSPALKALKARGFIDAMTDAQAIDDAFAAGMVTFYVGYDPTASSLHAGSLTCIMVQRLLQRLGHKPIVLLGSGTARVGDPTGKTESRRMLGDDELDENVAGIRRNFDGFLHFDSGQPNDAVMVDNYDWLGGLGYLAFLRDVGSQFTVNRMIAAKTYRDRLDNEQPLSFLEFNYQLLQAYDFLHLYREQGCTMQLGGSDQWGNMVAGTELIRRMVEGESSAQALTWPLLLTSDGRKMGKTADGAVWLDPAQCKPFDYYQYWVGCHDDDVRNHLLKYTDLPVEEVDELCKAQGAALRDVKARLAREATTLAHGAEAAAAAETAAKQAFGGGDDWSAVPAVEIGVTNIGLLDLVVHPDVGAFKSKREARQRIDAGAVKVDGEPVKDPAFVLDASAFDDATARLQAGKKKRFRIVLK